MKLKNLKQFDIDTLLNLLGLETRPTTTSWIAGTLGTFGIGLLAGAGLGLILAPKFGRELRDNIRNRMRHNRDDLSGPVQGPHRE